MHRHAGAERVHERRACDEPRPPPPLLPHDGEKLRDANPLQFSTLDLAWQAHKVRNDIAHAGEGFHLSEREANATIDLYRRVFEEFDFI